MEQKKWQIDPTHSEIGFSVKHMMFTTVKGTFKDFSVQINSGSDFFDETVFQFSAAIQSIDTANEDRDNHLKSADFFDAEQYPELRFHSISFRQLEGQKYELIGELQIKEVVKEIKLRVEVSEAMTDPWGNSRIALRMHTAINRKDWGLNWNAALETGGVLVSEEVNLSIEAQFIAS